MKRMLWVALFALALPLAAFADNTVDFANQGGTITGSDAGLSLSGSVLTGVNGLNGMGIIGGNLGSVSFSTGALISGNLSSCATGCSFAPGGTFVITGNGTNNIPAGTIFSGTFTNFTLTHDKGKVDGFNIYTFTATITGTWANGTTSTAFITGGFLSKNLNGTSSFASSDTFVSTVPEPGTLGLLGAGLVGVAGLLKRKAKA